MKGDKAYGESRKISQRTCKTWKLFVSEAQSLSVLLMPCDYVDNDDDAVSSEPWAMGTTAHVNHFAFICLDSHVSYFIVAQDVRVHQSEHAAAAAAAERSKRKMFNTSYATIL